LLAGDGITHKKIKLTFQAERKASTLARSIDPAIG
jgi:hypothetical protein